MPESHPSPIPNHYRLPALVVASAQIPEKDTNVLRAVKVNFHGWGAAMDAWLPVDSGMVARPGTHLPVLNTSEPSASSIVRPRARVVCCETYRSTRSIALYRTSY